MPEPTPGDFYPVDPRPKSELVSMPTFTEPHRLGLPAGPVALKELDEIDSPTFFDQKVLATLEVLRGRSLSTNDLYEFIPIFKSLGIRTQVHRYFKVI